MDNIPFDAIISLLMFLVGVPVLVLQFMSPEIRSVLKVEVEIVREISFYLVTFFLIVAASLTLISHYENRASSIWLLMFVLLFILVTYSAAKVLLKYGFRANVLRQLTKDILRQLPETGKPNKEIVENLIEIGKQSAPGPQREMVLEAMGTVVYQTCKKNGYRGDSLETLIIGIVHILSTKPTREDTRNYETAVGILTTILISSIKDENENRLIDHFHAVNALSTIGRTLLLQTDTSNEIDYILMDFDEVLGLVVSIHSELLPDVTQALLNLGSIALHNGRYLFAVATMERMMTLIEEISTDSPKPRLQMLGLTAHFWSAGGSSKSFIESRLNRLSILFSGSLIFEMEKASLRFQTTMDFDTADKLRLMGTDLKQPTKRRKK